MLRVIFTIALPLILPTALYLVWIRVARSSPGGSPAGSATELQPAAAVRWTALPWVWLAAAGAVLLAVVLFVVTVHFGTSQPGTYVPPRWENGRIVPSHIEPLHDR